MIDRLTPDEQHALLELLVHLAKADGNIREGEHDALAMYAELLDADLAEINGDSTLEELTAQFQSAASKVIALQELFRLSHLDGWFAENEQSEILEVGALMHVPMELLRKIDRWVLDGLDWMQRGEDLLDEAETEVV